MTKNRLLLRTLLLSTSSFNILKHSKDKKKKGKIIGGFVASGFLYLFLMAFCILICIGYGEMGLIDYSPLMCALVISLLAFVFTLFKTNGYLFNFKEYDMLMALPFTPSAIAGCKFLYMYINSLPWYMSISIAMMAGYGWYARPAFYIYAVWVVLSFFLPLIPMLIAAFFGFLIAKISAGFKFARIVETAIVMAFVIFCFSIRFFIEDVVRNDNISSTLESVSEITENTGGIYLPAGWFSDAVTKGSISSMLLLAGVALLAFSVIFYIVGRYYRGINSAFDSHRTSGKYRLGALKQRSAVFAIAFKEFKRMTGSGVYMTNVGIGVVLASLFSIITLVIGFENIFNMIMHDAPIDYSILQPAIPFIIYFFIGMVSTTACSPSLEGKNYWIVKSLPIDNMTLYRGKMLFNVFFTVPFMLFSVLCLCISARVPVLDSILYIILGVSLCLFSTCWGMVCGIKHMRLDWENEIEVIKQGAAVTLYLLPNMFVVMGLIVLMVFLGMSMSHSLLAVIMIVIVLALTAICYARVVSLARR